MSPNTPNARLRAARTATGLSQERLAERVNVEIERATGTPGALEGATISRMERGEIRRPRQRTVDALCRVLSASTSELGFEPSVADLDAITYSTDKPWRVDTEALDAVESVLAGVRTLEDSTSASAVLPSIRGLMPVVDDYARNARTAMRQRAVELASELHTYYGWLALDTYDYGTAARHFREGVALGVEADAPDHMSQGLSFDGFLALIQERYAASASLVQAAQRHSTRLSLSTFYALLAARTLAIAGERSDSDAQLREADRLLERCDGSDLDSRTYWYTPGFLVAQRGLVHAYAGRKSLAAADLSDGLAGMPPEQREAGWARLMRTKLAEAA